MALFITFEGGEGSGKTYQSKALYNRLSKLGILAVLTHEPGGTSLGERITRVLKWSEATGISPLTELLLFNASRAQLMEEVVKPALQDGKIVICDRYTDSTTAYQSYGRELDLERVKAVNNIGSGGLSPDLTVLLDMPVEKGLARKKTGKPDRFEQEDIDFHRRVREGYLQLAAEEPERWLVVDAGLPKKEIEEIIWNRVNQLL